MLKSAPHLFAKQMRQPFPLSDQVLLIEPDEIQTQISKKLDQYLGRSFFECFSLLLGKAQILEFGLKTLLSRECSISQNAIEKWTLGRVTNELEIIGIRGDYIVYLKRFVVQRNYIAHEMLANNAAFRSMAGNISERFEFSQIRQPIIDLEHLLIVYDLLELHKAWRYREDIQIPTKML